MELRHKITHEPARRDLDGAQLDDYECPRHRSRWRRLGAREAARTCLHAWQHYEHLTPDAASILTGDECVLCGTVKPGPTRRSADTRHRTDHGGALPSNGA